MKGESAIMKDYIKEFSEQLNLEDKFDQALLLDMMLFDALLEQDKKRKAKSKKSN